MGATAEGEAILHATEGTAFEFGDLLVEYGLPLVGGLAGFVAGPGLIGGNALWNALNDALGANSPIAPTRLVGLILGGIMLIIGGMLFSWGTKGNIWQKAIGRGLGAFGIGTGISFLVKQTIGNQPIAAGKGLLDSGVAMATQAAQ